MYNCRDKQWYIDHSIDACAAEIQAVLEIFALAESQLSNLVRRPISPGLMKDLWIVPLRLKTSENGERAGKKGSFLLFH